jgi:hypothetical protein
MDGLFSKQKEREGENKRNKSNDMDHLFIL